MSFIERVEEEAKSLEQDVESLIHPAPEPESEGTPEAQIVTDVKSVLAKLEDYKGSNPQFKEFDRAIDLVKVVLDTLARVTAIL
jgi:hypothetical protein